MVYDTAVIAALLSSTVPLVKGWHHFLTLALAALLTHKCIRVGR